MVRAHLTQQDLLNLKPAHSSFVGIDSDGCVFPTMDLKQRQCFHPLIVSHWNLGPVARQLRETAEFVNLFSRWRGSNRFTALVHTMDLLRERPSVRAAGVDVPRLEDLRRWISSGVPLSNSALQVAVDASASAGLASVLRWSIDVNAAIAETVTNTAPFDGVRRSLDRIAQDSDIICVSQTPAEALLREWEQHHLLQYVAAIAGQELGTKSEHIELATRGRYAPRRVLMIGDAPGDFKAAEDNRALFYPICPGREPVSWERFIGEAYDRFLTGTYEGSYQQGLVREFHALLPDTPAWED